MQAAIIRAQGPGSVLARAIGTDGKGRASPLLYAAGIALSFVLPALAAFLYAGVALIWLVPDRRVQRAHRRHGREGDAPGRDGP